MDTFNKLSCKDCGPGGMKCTCCGPPPGPQRKRLRRRIRSRFKEFTRKELQMEDLSPQPTLRPHPSLSS